MTDKLATTLSTRIADLSPSLSTLSQRSIKAVVTLIWPYSSSNSTLTILLAEPDFRLRKAKGQVRVKFSGSSARSVFESGVGSGDEITLGLEGVEWLKDDSISQTPGRSVEWELKYAERLLLRVQEAGTKKITLLNIDHPEPQPQTELIEIPSSPELALSPPAPTVPASRPGLKRSDNSEWASPAFVKRARVSYGSLFASGYDMFADDNGTVSGQGRKRSLFSRDSSSWRYSSRSASPEAEALENDIVEAKALGYGIDGPTMTDEGCQTIGLDGDAATETLAYLPAGEASVSQIEVVGKEVTNREGLSSVDGSLGLEAVVSPATPLFLAEIGVHEESNFQGGRTEEKETSQFSPRLHPTLIENLPTDQIKLPSTPKIVAAGDTLRGDDDDIGFDGGKRKSPGAQYDVPNQHVPLPHERNEAEDLHGLSPVTHGRIEMLAEEPEQSQMLLAQEYTHAAVLPIYPDPEASLNSEHYPRSPYYGEDQEISHAFEAADKSSHHSDDVSDTLNHQYEDQPHPDTSLVLPSSATSILRYEKAQYRGLQNPSIRDAKALRPNTAGIVMSRSQSAHSEMIDLTEDSDVGDSCSEDELQSYPDYDEGQVREEYEDVEQEEEGYDEDEDEDDDDDESRRYSNEQATEDESADESQLNSTYPRDFRMEDHLVQGELEEYDEDMSDQEDDYSEDGEPNDYDGGSTAVKHLPRGEPEVIDLLSSDDEGIEENNGNQPLQATEDHGFLTPTQNPKGEDDVSDRDAYGEVEGYEGEGEEGNIKQNALLDGTRLIQAERLHQDYTNHESDCSVGIGFEEEKSEDCTPGEQELVEVEQSRPEAAIELQFADGAGDLREEHPQEDMFSNRLGGYDGVNDDTDVETGPLIVAKAQATTAGVTPLIEINGEIEYTVSPTDDIAQEGMADPEVEAPQDDQIATEDLAMEIHGVKDQDSLEVHVFQDELMLKKNQANSLSNGQLPTPDATQTITSAASEPLLYPNLEPEHNQHPSSEPSIETQASLPQDSIQIEEISTPKIDQVMNETAHEDSRLGHVNHYKRTEKIGQVEPEEHMLQTIETSIDSVSVEEPSEQSATPQKLKSRQILEPTSAEIESSSVRSNDSPTPEFFDASATLAMVALESPSAREREQESYVLSDIALRVKLSRPLHTRLGHFTTLKLVRFNLEKKIDILAIVASIATEPSRAKNGPRHFHLHFKVTDASLMPTSVLPVHIFRPHKAALPSVKPGDGVLLRSFTAKAEPKAGFGLRSDESSSWVVFKGNGEEEIRGPPVEFGDEEREHVIRLGGWFHGLDAKSKERLQVTGVDKEKEKDRKGKGS